MDYRGSGKQGYEMPRPDAQRVEMQRRAAVKRLKRKNRRKSVWIIILLIIILLLCALIGYGVFKQHRDSKKPSMQYISMTEEAAARAYVWLSKIEDIELSYDDVKECMGDFNLEVVKTPIDKNTYKIEPADGAYEYCRSQASIGLEKAYKMAVCRRIKASGYEGTASDEVVEEIMMKTFGMTVEQYLKECNIELLPTEAEVQEKYAGEVSDETDK